MADDAELDARQLDCLACGACCHGDEGWVPVGREDDARVDATPALARHVVLLRHGEYAKRSLRMVDGACSALARDGGPTRCTIYEDRPSLCRALQVGSPGCLSARRAHGL